MSGIYGEIAGKRFRRLYQFQAQTSFTTDNGEQSSNVNMTKQYKNNNLGWTAIKKDDYFYNIFGKDGKLIHSTAPGTVENSPDWELIDEGHDYVKKICLFLKKIQKPTAEELSWTEWKLFRAIEIIEYVKKLEPLWLHTGKPFPEDESIIQALRNMKFEIDDFLTPNNEMVWTGKKSYRTTVKYEDNPNLSES